MGRELKDLMNLMPQRRWFLALSVFEAVRGFCLVQGEAHGIKLIADGAVGSNATALWQGVLLLAAALALGTAGVIVGDYYSQKITVLTKAAIRDSLLSTVLCRKTADSFSSGDLLYRLTRDVDDTMKLYRAVHFLIGSLGKIVSSLIVGFYLSWQLSLILLTMGAVKVLLDSLLVRRIQQTAIGLKRAESQLSEQIEEHVRGIIPVRMLAVRELVSEQFDQFNHRLGVHKMTQARLSAAADTILRLFEFLAVLVVLGVGSRLVLQRSISVGALAAFVTMYDNLINPYRFIGDFIKRYRTHNTAYRRIQEVLNSPESVGVQAAFPAICLNDTRFELVVDNLTFGYTSDGIVFKDISFSACSGQLTYIVGKSGIGKTTLLRVLMGFLLPLEGRIYLQAGGQRYSGPIDRRLFSYISQDAFVFSGSVLENIAFAGSGVDMQRVVQAARHAGIHTVIEQLPDGYQTVLGDGGRELSGGEKRRLVLARAFYRDAPIVLLDEVLASLDNNSAQLVQQSIAELCRANRCVIMISHRREWIPPGARVVELG